MTGFSAAQRRRDSRCCSNFRAVSARSTKSTGPVWAYSVEKLDDFKPDMVWAI